jgi:hypothetical protein
VTIAEDIDAVAALAREIWTEQVTPIIGKAQVDYMLEMLQRAPATGWRRRSGAVRRSSARIAPFTSKDLKAH